MLTTRQPAACPHNARMPENSDRARDHLANERTLLAWVRTGVALVGLGFVVARFSYLLRTLSAEAHRTPPPQSAGGTALGVGIVVVGGGTVAIAVRRFLRARAGIERGEYSAAAGSLVALSALVVLAAVILAVYVGVSGQAA